MERGREGKGRGGDGFEGEGRMRKDGDEGYFRPYSYQDIYK